MKIMYLGEVVRKRRESLRLSQEMVCEGLCTTMTLSRFESGRQTPSRDCVTAILQRLGLPDDRYYAQLTSTETRLIRLKKEVLAYCSQFEHTLEDDRQQIRMNALETLCKLERSIKGNDRINQQFILRSKVTLEVYPPQEQLEVLMDAIRLTSPRFNLDELGNCLYSTNEVLIINQIAIRYSFCGERRKAIDIYRQLLKLVRMRTPAHNRISLIAYNYALQLALERRWDEALEISELVRKDCIKQGYYHFLPRLLHIEADCHYNMGDLNKSAGLYQSANYIYGAIMDTRNQTDLEIDAQKRFNLMF